MSVPAPQPDRAALAAIADLLSRRAVAVLTGAGMSTESGIPDYRGPDGTRRVRPMEYAEFVGSAAARQRYWARAYVGWARFSAARPNAGHRVVAALQRTGHLGPIVTQNVDGLHQEAGATDVLELHGTLAVVRCLTCEDRSPRDVVQARLAAANPGFGSTDDDPRALGRIQPDGDVALADHAVRSFRLVRCRSCGADTLKPDVVYFGESVPKERVALAYAAVEAGSALLVLGSSLQVMSGYRFVRHAHKRGTRVAIITRGKTRGDAEATHRLDAGLGESLVALAAALGVTDDFGAVVDGEYATGLPLGLV
ncbi:MAG: NAD-dependent protein deacetylase [Austwickia sp.]|nr:NAD-dependent protein deacetylase [Austwickia sp.]